jgi:pyruvyltransferase
MHGLIAADSLHVPNAWLKLSDELRGEDFKFRDYYSVFNIEPKPLAPVLDLFRHTEALIETYSRPGLDDIKQQLIESFPFKS